MKNSLLATAVTAKCLRDGVNISDIDFAKKASYGAINSFVKGLYNDPRAYPLDQACMGDWMDESLKTIEGTVETLTRRGPFAVGKEGFKAATNAGWDLVFINIDSCGGSRMLDDVYQWCLGDLGKCTFQSGLVVKNLVANSGSIIKDSTTLAGLVMADDMCYTDE